MNILISLVVCGLAIYGFLVVVAGAGEVVGTIIAYRKIRRMVRKGDAQ